jgi:nitrous oxide reductase accessory protein NosL
MNIKHHAMLAALSVLLILLVVAGCGAGNEPAEASLTKAEFRKQADLICTAAANEQFRKAGIYLNKHPGTKEVDLVEPAAIPPLEKEIRELSALSPPSEQQEDVRTYISDLEKALRKIKEEPSSAIDKTNNPYNNSNTLARHLGMGDCSGNP